MFKSWLLPATSHQQIWKFPVHNNRSRFGDGGVAFFKSQSKTRAKSLGRNVASYANVELVRSPPNAWNVVGTVVLDAA